jgi:cytochrome c556
VQTAIEQARPGFNAAARVLQDAAGEALAAIDKKDPAALIVAGGKLDQACEGCHSVYWYTKAKLPSAKAWPAIQPSK